VRCGGSDTGICKQGEVVRDKNKDGQVLLSHIVCWAGAVQVTEYATVAQNWPRMHQSEPSGARGREFTHWAGDIAGPRRVQHRVQHRISLMTESDLLRAIVMGDAKAKLSDYRTTSWWLSVVVCSHAARKLTR
jgi:heme A synthase